MRIDPHVHCRDWAQAYKSTVRYVYGLAVSQGVGIIFDMPNTDPPIISENDVAKRLALAKDFPGYYVFIGATKHPSQLSEAAHVAATNPRVVGIKMYAGGSVGDLAIIDESDQAQVYEELSKCDYKGVLAVHCEKESLFKPELWDFQKPYTWNDARPEISEIESVKDQIDFARRAGFEGILHICHVSSPRTVELVQKARKEIRITCGATPHHLTYSTDDMQDAQGLRYKVNP
ncbi:MAG: dihydroorotase, partial [Candidatus Aenigmatarchaeota archaeon]